MSTIPGPTEPIPEDATDPEFDAALVESGLFSSYEMLYPSEFSQSN